MDLPVYDYHFHGSPSGRNVDAMKEYKAAGGTGMTLVTLPYPEVQITCGEDFRRSFQITVEYAKKGRELGLDINLAKIDISKAVARENFDNSAAILGGASGTKDVEGQADMGYYEMQTVEVDDYDVIDSVTYKLKKTGKTITSSEAEEKQIPLERKAVSTAIEEVYTGKLSIEHEQH